MDRQQFINALRTDSNVDVTEYDDNTLARYIRSAINEQDPSIDIADDASATGIETISSTLYRPIILLAQIAICLNRAAKAAQYAAFSSFEGSVNYASIVDSNIAMVTHLRDEYDTYNAANGIGGVVIEVSELIKKRPYEDFVKGYPKTGSTNAVTLSLTSYVGTTAKISWTPYTGTMFWKYAVYTNTSDVFADATQNNDNAFNVAASATLEETFYDVRSNGAEIDVASLSYVCVVLFDIAGRVAFSNSVQVGAV